MDKMPMPAAAGANAARHKFMDGTNKRRRNDQGGDQRITAADLLRPPRRSRDDPPNEEEQAKPEKPERQTPQVSCSWLQTIINFIYDKRKIKRSPITPWMVEGSFHPDNLVGTIPAPNKRLKEGIMHKVGVGDL